ncbi:MAG: ATPase, T2SS/T4P/T4SS family [Conexivisphaera sp.]
MAQKKVGLKLNIRSPIHLGSGGKAKGPAPSQEYRARPVRVTAVPGRVLEEYDVGEAHVIIADDGEKYLYLVEEPALTERDGELYALIMESLYYSLRPVETRDLMAHIDSFVWQVAEDLGIVDEVKEAWPRLRYYVRRDSVGYGVIDVPMRDPALEEISCTGPGRPVAVIHRNYPSASWLDTNIQFVDDEEMRRFVQRLMQRAGKGVTIARPLGDAMTPDGHRVAVTLGNEITLPGSTFSIRKFTEQPLTITHLVTRNTLSSLIAAYMWIVLEQKGFTFIVGGTGSGKTTTMNALLGMLDPRAKIATIEETAELNIPHVHWERLVARISYMGESKFDIGLFDLTRLSLRLRPDYVVVGEARGEEIQALFQSAASVAYDTPVLVRVDGEVRRARIGEVVDAEYGAAPDWTPVAPGRRLEVLTLTPEGRVDFRPVRYVLRHRTDRVYRVRYAGGEVRATGSHSVFVLDEDTLELRPKRVDEIRPGDVLVTFRKRGRGRWRAYERKRSFVLRRPAAMLLYYILENAKTPFTDNARLLADRIRWFIASEAEVTVVKEVREEPYDGYVYDFSVPDTEAFFGGAAPILLHNSGHGALSSFHADSPQAALVRMSAPPLNVGQAAQMLIWTMVMMNRVRLPGGEIVRRAIQVTEIQPESGEIRLRDIFTWDARSDSFEPDDPVEVRKRSTRLATVERLTGIDAVEEMRNRAAFVEELAKRRIFDYRELAKEFSAWYRQRYGGSS